MQTWKSVRIRTRMLPDQVSPGLVSAQFRHNKAWDQQWDLDEETRLSWCIGSSESSWT